MKESLNLTKFSKTLRVSQAVLALKKWKTKLTSENEAVICFLQDFEHFVEGNVFVEWF